MRSACCSCRCCRTRPCVRHWGRTRDSRLLQSGKCRCHECAWLPARCWQIWLGWQLRGKARRARVYSRGRGGSRTPGPVEAMMPKPLQASHASRVSTSAALGGGRPRRAAETAATTRGTLATSARLSSCPGDANPAIPRTRCCAIVSPAAAMSWRCSTCRTKRTWCCSSASSVDSCTRASCCRTVSGICPMLVSHVRSHSTEQKHACSVGQHRWPALSHFAVQKKGRRASQTAATICQAS